MATREDTSLRRSLTSLVPPKRIRSLASELGVVQRRRKVDVVALVYALALGFSVGARRSLAGLRRAYERATGTTLAWERLLKRLVLQSRRAPARAALSTHGVAEVRAASDRVNSGRNAAVRRDRFQT